MAEPTAAPAPAANYDPAEAEARWRKTWDEWAVYAYDPTRPRSETFAIDTPPPTASGSLHVGHAFSYTHQDLLARYRRMNGFNVFFPMGWDDNGLPTERRVENLFNVRCNPALPANPDFQPPPPDAKGPPAQCGRADFIRLCAKATAQDEEVYKELWQRMGLSVDWHLEYATIGELARKVCQYSLVKLWQQKNLYAADAPMQWDPVFRTAIAQAEVEDREEKANFYTLKFAVRDAAGAELGHAEIATTRPELLGACVAVVVHPEDERYTHLVGKTAVTPLFKVAVPVIADAKVQKEKGTGVVMVCTFGDQTDVEWWREYKLPTRPLLTRAGRIDKVEFGTPEWPSEDPAAANAVVAQVAGIDLAAAKLKTAELLKAEGALLGDPKPIVHAVKFYEKGSKPLEILLTRQWFVKLLDKKEELVAQGDKVQWHPAFMKDRYTNWVNGLKMDWCVSRQRFFGVPFPIWYPTDADGNPKLREPIFAAIETLPVDPMSDVPPGYTESQRNQPNGFVGEPDVLDTWATSGLTPQLNTRWDFDPERTKNLFPMDVRPQSHEIIRTWAFYTIALSYMHGGTVPWHHAVISGWILDPDRKKMSKSKGNVVTPVGLLDTYSADAVRYWAARARPGVDTAYDENLFKDGKKTATKLFNAARFVTGILDKHAGTDLHAGLITHETDLGFVARLKEVVAQATAGYEAFDWATPLARTEEFFWAEFCDDYLEMVKNRAARDNGPAARSAAAGLKLGLHVLLRLYAPTLPFISEELWSKRFAGEGRTKSVHTSPWPTAAEFSGIPAPADAGSFAAARGVLGSIRREKGVKKLSIRWPVETLTVAAPSVTAALKQAFEDVADAGNVKAVAWTAGESVSATVTLAAAAG